MRASRAVALGLAAWLTAAGVGSAMTWAVISRAGSEVVTPAPTAAREPGSARAPQAQRRDAPSRPRRSERGAAEPGAGELSSPSSRSPEPVPPSPTSSPTSATTPQSEGRPGSGPSASAPPSSPSSPSSSSSPDADRQRTWQGPGGTVVVTCRGERAELDAAQPDSGYHVEVRDRGPDEVEVDFEGQGTNEDAGTRVRATCESGEPRFDADVDRG